MKVAYHIVLGTTGTNRELDGRSPLASRYGTRSSKAECWVRTELTRLVDILDDQLRFQKAEYRQAHVQGVDHQMDCMAVRIS